MLCDLFRRLGAFGKVEEYAYVGFGSVWFSDFSLFHRALGIKDMISIEQAETARERIEDNKPFRIPIDFRKSKEALPDLDWTKKQFIWLDYDDPLSLDMLLDMRSVARRARSGTVLSVSVQCSKAPQLAQAEQENTAGSPNALDRFVGIFGRDRVPQATTEDDLYGWQFGKLSRDLLEQEIQAELAARNSGGQLDVFQFTPICAFEYEDGARMTTIVGIFHTESDRPKVEQCNFASLDFLSGTSAPVRITIPKLTVREFKKLESQLPLPSDTELEFGSIPENDGRRFADMYRYLPNFAVLET